jgi:hypothetical protein
MITDPAQIRERLDQLTTETEAHNIELKHQIEDLQSNMFARQITRRGSRCEFGDNVHLRIGPSKAAKIVRSNASYDMVVSAFQSVMGVQSKHMGSKVDQGRSIWLRTNFDIKFVFSIYFAGSAKALELDALPQEQVQPFDKFDLRKEQPYKDGMAVFKVECAGPAFPLIFLAFPGNMALEAANQYLKHIFGEVSSMELIDDAGDIISIDSPESWDYGISLGARLSKLGYFPLLSIQIA